MSVQRQDRLVSLLVQDGGWQTTASLADRLGVTGRTVRSYVTAVNARVPDHPAIVSGPSGYRADARGVAALRAGAVTDDQSPRDRLYRLVRTLIDEVVDVHDAASQLHVSEATIEADISRVRTLVRSDGELKLVRSGSTVRLDGSELARRRLLSTLMHDEMADGAFDVEMLRRVVGTGAVSAGSLGEFKVDLASALGEAGYFVNEFAVADVALHVSIAVDRARQGRGLAAIHGEPTAEQQRLADMVGRLALDDLGTELGPGDRLHLASLLLTRVVVPDAARPGAVAERDPVIDAAVRASVARVSREYLVELAGGEFLDRLTLHVQNLVHRAREQAWSRNPLARSLKSTYPMIFEVAVAITNDLSERLGISVGDDEIAYIAMHVGGELERGRDSSASLSATIVCPGYYELHELLRSSVTRSLGQAVTVTDVITRIDPEWDAIATDLVLTTIAPPVPSDRIVQIRPFLTDADVERVNQAAGRLRRTRRLARLRVELDRYFDAGAFVVGLDDSQGEAGIIRQLGGLLVDAGVIDDAYVEAAIARESMSSTAFTDALAVPHALRMTATRTALAVGIGRPSVAWGDGRVQVVAFAAFSESDREAFQTVFELFVEVFVEHENVQRLVRVSSLPAFLDELVTIIGA
ncbi:MAG: PRD domain-containing protein [Microbacterium sp.]